MRSETNIIVKVIDMSNLEAMASEKFAENEKLSMDRIRANAIHKWGYVETPRGKFLLNDEGIMLIKPWTETETMTVDILVETKEAEEDRWSFPLIPQFNINLKVSCLDDLEANETESLEKFIRSFGSRMECNYEECVTALEKEMIVIV